MANFYILIAFLLATVSLALSAATQQQQVVPYPIQNEQSCAVGQKFVRGARTMYVFLCQKGDHGTYGEIVGCRNYEGNEIAIGATYTVHGDKYQCKKNAAGSIVNEEA